MAILERSIGQKKIINTLLLSLAVGVLLFMLLFSLQAKALNKLNPDNATNAVHIAGLQLVSLRKVAVSGGHRVTLKLFWGLGAYFVAFLAFGSVIAYLRTKISENTESK